MVFGSGSGQVVAMTCNLDADYVPPVGSVHGLNLHRDDVLEVHQAHSDWVSAGATRGGTQRVRVLVEDGRAVSWTRALEWTFRSRKGVSGSE